LSGFLISFAIKTFSLLCNNQKKSLKVSKE